MLYNKKENPNPNPNPNRNGKWRATKIESIPIQITPFRHFDPFWPLVIFEQAVKRTKRRLRICKSRESSLHAHTQPIDRVEVQPINHRPNADNPAAIPVPGN